MKLWAALKCSLSSSFLNTPAEHSSKSHWECLQRMPENPGWKPQIPLNLHTPGMCTCILLSNDSCWKEKMPGTPHSPPFSKVMIKVVSSCCPFSAAVNLAVLHPSLTTSPPSNRRQGGPPFLQGQSQKLGFGTHSSLLHEQPLLSSLSLRPSNMLGFSHLALLDPTAPLRHNPLPWRTCLNLPELQSSSVLPLATSRAEPSLCISISTTPPTSWQPSSTLASTRPAFSSSSPIT